MSTHIPADLALFLAALDPGDAEREQAWAHAARCPQCQQLLERSAAMLELIDAQAREQPVNQQLRRRILASVERLEPRTRRTRWEPIALALGTFGSALLALFDGQRRPGLHAAQGLHCIFWEVVFACAPLAAAGLWALSDAGRRRPDPLRYACAGMLGAFLAQLRLRAICPDGDMHPHTLVFHTAGVLLGAGLGAVAAYAAQQRT